MATKAQRDRIRANAQQNREAMANAMDGKRHRNSTPNLPMSLMKAIAGIAAVSNTPDVFTAPYPDRYFGLTESEANHD